MTAVTVHFYHNMISVLLLSKMKRVNQMSNAVQAQKSKKADREKTKAMGTILCSMTMKEVNNKTKDDIEETLIYYDFLSEH